jgi:hypothetical protein
MNWKFWKKDGNGNQSGKTEKLSGPKDLPASVGRFIVVELKQDPDWTWRLKSVERLKEGSKHIFDVRIFDMTKSTAKGVAVKNYYSLDNRADLILFEGRYNKVTNEAKIIIGPAAKKPVRAA